MQQNLNLETHELLKQNLKLLRSRCVDVCNIIYNAPLDAPSTTHEEINEKTLTYIESLRMDLQTSSTPIITDKNLLSSQFLTDLQAKSKSLEELCPFTKASIHELDVEIKRLRKLINIAEEAKTQPKSQKRKVQPEHVMKAKEKFQFAKNELYSLIKCLFKHNSDMVVDIFGELMGERLNESSNGYIKITEDTFKVVDLLRDMNIVTTNPYNNMEIKLAY